jgi:hypothetical protein
MSEYNTYPTNEFAYLDKEPNTMPDSSLTPLADLAEAIQDRKVLAARVQEISAELENLRGAYRSLRSGMEDGLQQFAEDHLDSSDDSYQALSDLMVEHGMSGLKREFEVTVRATYEFTVYVTATDEDEARNEVDNDLTNHVHDNVSLYDTPDDYDIEVDNA